MEPLLTPGAAPVRGYATLPDAPRRTGRMSTILNSKGRVTAIAVFSLAATLLVAIVFSTRPAAHRIEEIARCVLTGNLNIENPALPSSLDLNQM